MVKSFPLTWESNTGPSPRESSTLPLDQTLFLFCFLLFCVRPSDFYRLFKVRQHVIDSTNHDIVVGLCSKLFIRFFYSIHIGYGKKLSSHMGIERRSFSTWIIYSTPRPDSLLADYGESGPCLVSSKVTHEPVFKCPIHQRFQSF